MRPSSPASNQKESSDDRRYPPPRPSPMSWSSISIVVRANAPIEQAAELMDRHHISGLPVVDTAGTLVGVVSQTDLVRARSTEYLWANWPGLSVRHLMTSPPVTVQRSTPLAIAAARMERHHIHRLVVVADDDETLPIGILSIDRPRPRHRPCRARRARGLIVMCLGFPGRVVAVDPTGATVETDGRRRRANTLLAPDLAVGEWVYVSAGTVIERLDARRGGIHHRIHRDSPTGDRSCRTDLSLRPGGRASPSRPAGASPWRSAWRSSAGCRSSSTATPSSRSRTRPSTRRSRTASRRCCSSVSRRSSCGARRSARSTGGRGRG